MSCLPAELLEEPARQAAAPSAALTLCTLPKDVLCCISCLQEGELQDSLSVLVSAQETGTLSSCPAAVVCSWQPRRQGAVGQADCCCGWQLSLPAPDRAGLKACCCTA